MGALLLDLVDKIVPVLVHCDKSLRFFLNLLYIDFFRLVFYFIDLLAILFPLNHKGLS